jgi:hypothetical protein
VQSSGCSSLVAWAGFEENVGFVTDDPAAGNFVTGFAICSDF